MNFSSTFPMVYTALFGAQKTLIQKAEAQKKTYKVTSHIVYIRFIHAYQFLKLNHNNFSNIKIKI
ncbi:hypothetical protein [Acinetobacter sp. ANC 3832]|uniref:hypothetical protein n=1 Tax=Acinetobacter sp. ANC 3832 TaxID=1977874 RepID=UPI000A33BE1A|nr:hypothetical protein [Acinetobacter sp. ANC 3832]OTG95446.1 hypothetical protein B9T35_02610 [Acinetobacter sp. ANC 3832]